MIGKLLSQAAATILAGLIPFLVGGPLGTVEWLNIIVMASGVLLVGVVPNLTGGVGKYSKLIVSAVIAVVTLAVSYLADNHLSTEEVIQLILAAAAAFGVYQFPAPQWGGAGPATPVVVPEQRA